MPYRSLPNSTATRIAALDGLHTKSVNTPAAERPYPQALQDQLEPLRAQFKAEAGQAAVALSAQGTATTQATLDFLALQTVVSHFVQVFNLAVARGVYPREARALYQLDISSSTVPPIATQADAVTWAGHLIAGEASRMATAGAIAMSNPSAAEVQAALDAYQASGATQSTAKDKYDTEQGDVAALRPAVDAFVLDAWETIEFTFRQLDGPSKRRRAREWGVVYVTRPGETPDPEVPAATPPVAPVGEGNS